MAVNMEFLQALATVCEAAPRLALPSSGHKRPEAWELSSVPLPRSQTLHRASSAAVSTLSHSMLPPRTPRLPGPYETPGGAPPAPHMLHASYGHCLPPYRPVVTPTTRDYTASSVPPFPTPPPTPANCTPFRHPYAPHYTQQPNHGNGYSLFPLPPQPSYPVMLSTPSPSPSPSPALTSTDTVESTQSVSHILFESYLNETWPEQSLRRGGSVIRDSLYQQVVAVLQGEEANARLKQWIKRSEFFLKERDGCTLLLAVPATRSRGGRKSGGATVGGKSETRGPHKLVAKLEDFPHIISSYHNSKTGHHGIRKTYGMVSHTIICIQCMRRVLCG